MRHARAKRDTATADAAMSRSAACAGRRDRRASLRARGFGQRAAAPCAVPSAAAAQAAGWAAQDPANIQQTRPEKVRRKIRRKIRQKVR
jgi:hypothetical protein